MRNPIIAAFDFDGTLTEKDSLLSFMKYTHGGIKFYAYFILGSPLLLLYKINILPNHLVKQIIFSWFYKGWTIERFNAICEDFTPILSRIERADTLEKLKKHQGKGDRVVIISASIENWIIPWAKNQDIDVVIGTQIEVVNSVLTGRFLSRNCYGKEKVTRLLEAFPKRNEYLLYAYGDSEGDNELLKFADFGFRVNRV